MRTRKGAHGSTQHKHGPSGRKQAYSRECDTCGNEIPGQESLCPFCGSQVFANVCVGPRIAIRTINIELGKPSVEEALRRLEREMWKARREGAKIVRLIHGWGSSGQGGKLRLAVRAYLANEFKAGRLGAIVHGEEYFSANPIVGSWMRQWRELRNSEQTDYRNQGLTFVEL